MSDTATYSLTEIQHAIDEGRYFVTRSASEGAASLYLDESDIKECIGMLTDDDFYKSLPSFTHKGMMQDVYKTRCWSFPIYLKLQLSRDSQAVVISFKRE